MVCCNEVAIVLVFLVSSSRLKGRDDQHLRGNLLDMGKQQGYLAVGFQSELLAGPFHLQILVWHLMRRLTIGGLQDSLTLRIGLARISLG